MRPCCAGSCSGDRAPQLALALDATTLGDRFAVLAISVLYRGCASPVACAVLPATAQGAWKTEWVRLLQQLPATIPATMMVIVLADRGLYARWLFQAIVHLGWHPLLRVNAGGLFRPQGWARWRSLASFVPQPDTRWQGCGTAFKTCPLNCTLLACWEPVQAERWLLVTDLPPAASTAAW